MHLLLHGRDDAHRIDFTSHAVRFDTGPKSYMLVDPRKVEITGPAPDGSYTFALYPDPTLNHLLETGWPAR